MWSHSCTCHTTRLSTSGMSHPAFNPQLQSITALWLAFISRPMSGRRFNWPEWQVTNTELELSAIKMVTTSVLTRPDIKQLRSMLLLSHHPIIFNKISVLPLLVQAEQWQIHHFPIQLLTPSLHHAKCQQITGFDFNCALYRFATDSDTHSYNFAGMLSKIKCTRDSAI